MSPFYRIRGCVWRRGGLRWAAVIVVPLVAAIIWGAFNVLDDPSRSGAAPVEVSGWIRLVLELVILSGGAVALALAHHRGSAMLLAVLVVAHYAMSLNRIQWLVQS